VGVPEEIERIRVAAEREAWAVLDAEEIRRYDPPPDAAKIRRKLQAESLQLSETMAPGVHALAKQAAARLGVEKAIEIYQRKDDDENARLVNDDPIAIEFVGSWLSALDGGAMLAILGHELGHHLAHTTSARYRWAWDCAWLAKTPAQCAYLIAAELTADRFGMLAARDLDSVLKLEMRIAGGSETTTIAPSAYLEQAKALVADLLRRDDKVVGRSHPEHSVRAWASWRFAESDLYRDLTGEGSGAVPISEIEAEITRVVGVLHLRDARAVKTVNVDVGGAIDRVADVFSRKKPEGEPTELRTKFEEFKRKQKT
jgi:hypothetical protein